MILLDTNLLIYAHRSGVPEHRAAQRAIELACDDPRGVGIAEASVAELWSVVTHPSCPGRPARPKEVVRFLRALVEGGIHLWDPGGGFALRLSQLAANLGISGPRIFDLRIALTGLDNGATELWTHDQNFVRPRGLKLRDPL